jgi:hypothetical protein
MTEDETRARGRFIVIQLVRLTGLGLFLFGLLAIAGRVALPEVAGYVMAAVGLVEMLIVPLILSRKWKSSKE